MTPTAVMEAVEEKALSVPDQARNFLITTNEDFQNADSLLTSWKGIEAEIHSAFDPIVDAAHKAHKEAVAQRKKYLDPIEQGRALLKPKMSAYADEQERKRKEAERMAQEEARKREEEAQLATALEAEKSGDTAAAEAIIAAPVEALAVTLPKFTPKVQTTFRESWSAEVTSLLDLVKAIAAGKAPLNLVIPNTVALNGLARSLKGTMAYPGVKAVSRKV